MRPVARASLCVALLAAFLLAGCSSSSNDTSPSGSGSTSHVATTSHSSSGAPGSGTSGASGGPTTGPTSGGNPANNHAPTGTVTASIQKGTLPLNVTFSLTGNDQDGDKLTWNLDADGDGKTDKSGDSLPATTSYNYTKAGNYTAKYVISDGKTTTAYPLPINVTAAASGGGPVATATGSYLAGADARVCAAGSPELSNGPANGNDQIDLAPTPEMFATHLVATWSGAAAPPVSYNLALLTPASGGTVSTISTASSASTSVEIDIPASDVGTILATSCGGVGTPPTGFTVTFVFTA